ncbi:MAG: outer membrane beta-barrel protein [Bacteroidetes bacterium]|nr:outer membrane beta-barrel protein [Bacteroidota bacterium]
MIIRTKILQAPSRTVSLIMILGLTLWVTNVFSQKKTAVRQPIVHVDSLPEVLFIGSLNASTELRARQLELHRVPILNIQSAESIEKSADISIADVTQRISGVSVIKNNIGLSDKTLIRGIDPKYNYTMINGLQIPSPDDRSRYISLSLFPAAMVSRLEVYKTLTADMGGGAIGGAMNIVMKDAPNETMVDVQISAGYNNLYFNRGHNYFNNRSVSNKSPEEIHGPLYSATVNDFSKDNLFFHSQAPLPNGNIQASFGKRFFDKKLGLIFSAIYQNENAGTDGFFIPQNAAPQINNLPNLTNFTNRHYDNRLTRYGLQNKWDYNINNHHRLSFFQMFSQQTDLETRFSIDTNLVQGRSLPGTGRVAQYQRSRTHLQNLYSAQVQGIHQLVEHWLLDWDIAYSIAKGLYPDWSELTATSALLLQPNGSIVKTPLILSPLTRTWLRNKEQDLSISPNLQYKSTFKQKVFTLKLGGLFREKWRSNFYNAYNFTPSITNPDGQPFIDIYHAQWLNNQPQNPLGSIGSSNTFNATEKIEAGFAQLNFKLGQLDINSGIRWENTEQQINTSINPLPGIGQQLSIQYQDWLPSLHLIYPLSTSLQLKGSYFKGITRPALYDLSFYHISYEDAAVVGNPFLKRSASDNLDLRLDYQGSKKDYLQVGLFYKAINNPFEKALLDVNDELYPIPSQGLAYTPAEQLTEQVRNFGNATIYGLELAASKTIKRFTFSANYTYSHSHIVQVKKFETREIPNDNSSNIITVSKMESRPLQGQSPHNANLVIAYSDSKMGFQAQVAMVYTSQRIFSVSGWYGLDYWQVGTIQNDFSIRQKINKSWQLFGNINHIFGNNQRVYIHQQNTDWGKGLLPGQTGPNRIQVQQEHGYASLWIGLKYKLPHKAFQQKSH